MCVSVCISVQMVVECVQVCVVSMMESASHISVCASLCIGDYVLCQCADDDGMCVSVCRR